MSLHAFYESTNFSGPNLSLGEKEAAHARVLRLKSGDQAEVFNGEGARAICRIERLGRKRVDLTIEEVFRTEKPKSRAIVATAVSKAVRRGFFMEKAAELGASQIWVWQARRSVGRLSPGLLESCRQQIVAGGKQARNLWFPQLVNVDNLAGLLLHTECVAPVAKILPWEDADRSSMLLPSQLGLPGDTIFAIGPEGGYAPEEVAQLQTAGFSAVSLGSQILRCETAAVLCLGLHTWASQLPEASPQ